MAQNTLKDIFSDIRSFMYGGIRTLPITISGTLLLIGLMSANYSILFFLIGMFIVPVLALGFNSITEFILSYTRFANIFKVIPNDVCNVVIPYKTMRNASSIDGIPRTILVSNWMAMTSFFFGYIITNAISLLNINQPDINIDVTSTEDTTSLPQKSNRVAQAGTSLAVIIATLLIILVIRYTTSCESVMGIIASLLIFGGLGASWYSILAQPGQQRLADLFGIANRILPSSAMINGPMACLPVEVKN